MEIAGIFGSLSDLLAIVVPALLDSKNLSVYFQTALPLLQPLVLIDTGIWSPSKFQAELKPDQAFLFLSLPGTGMDNHLFQDIISHDLHPINRSSSFYL